MRPSRFAAIVIIAPLLTVVATKKKREEDGVIEREQTLLRLDRSQRKTLARPPRRVPRRKVWSGGLARAVPKERNVDSDTQKEPVENITYPGRVYICGYTKMAKFIAENVFSDFQQSGLVRKSTVSTATDIIVIGMRGPCVNGVIPSFKGKRLYANGKVPPNSFIIGPSADSANTLRVYFLAQVANRFENFLDLLEPRTPHIPPKSLFYTSSHCCAHREQAFKQLSLIMRVYAGGRCHGLLGKNQYVQVSVPARPTGWETSVNYYSEYRFGLVFENTKADGYITEKILVAFLGGTVPIYFGTKEVLDIFNEHAFIYYDIANPQPALQRISHLEKNQTAYMAVFSQPILKNGLQTLEKYFSLTDDVGGGKLKQRIRDMVLGDQTTTQRPSSTAVASVAAAVAKQPLPKPGAIKHYVVCSWGGVRSKMVVQWLQQSAPNGIKVSHVHDRFPPKRLTTIVKERFSRTPVSEQERRTTAVIFLMRNPTKSISSRVSKQHCRNVQAEPELCAKFGDSKDENLALYVANGRDDWNLQKHWEAYADGEFEYPIIFFHSSDLWHEKRFPCIRDALALSPTVEPPKQLSHGDAWHRDSVHDGNRLHGALDVMYASLNATIQRWRDVCPPVKAAVAAG